MSTTLELLIGAPGTGKTERLIMRVEKALSDGIQPDAIIFTSYTRAAVQEARQRVQEKLKLEPESLPNFRTLHSLCFRTLGLHRDDVFSRQHMKELGELLGEDLSRYVDPTEGPLIGARGTEYLMLEQYARLTRQSLQSAWAEHGGELDWWRLRHIVDTYNAFKEDRDLLDFTDMLHRALTERASIGIVDDGGSIAILDEAQDLSALQWSVATVLFKYVSHVIVGMDPLQSVHRWAGADKDPIERAYSISVAHNRQRSMAQLKDNFRLPRNVASLAREIAQRCATGSYEFDVVSDVAGAVHRVVSLEEINLSQGTWLMLARGGYQLTELAAHARESGVIYSVKGLSSVDLHHATAIRAYETLRSGKEVMGDHLKTMFDHGLGYATRLGSEEKTYKWDEVFPHLAKDVLWHDALQGIPTETREYLLACLRRGEKLTERPRVRLETMHGAKGQEAENVVLVTDLPPRVAKGMEMDPDAEHRVFYVAATRARHNLYVLDPRTPLSYQMFT